jgi:midasin (ATPase involved in ribosome maturation)
VTIEDLQGRVVLSKDPVTGREGFQLLDSPFVTAFQKGYWLLLDEFNLAPDNVLQWIERAIDTGRVEVRHTRLRSVPRCTQQLHMLPA